jgi:glycerol-3-phosphate acyltransferase PlsY
LEHTPITFVVFSFVVAIILVWTHRKNIGRILDGVEPKARIWEYLAREISLNDGEKNADTNEKK